VQGSEQGSAVAGVYIEQGSAIASVYIYIYPERERETAVA